MYLIWPLKQHLESKFEEEKILTKGRENDDVVCEIVGDHHE